MTTQEQPVTNEAKAVAWVSERSLRSLARYREESMFVTSERSEFCTEPLYPAAEVERLEARVREFETVCQRILDKSIPMNNINTSVFTSDVEKIRRLMRAQP